MLRLAGDAALTNGGGDVNLVGVGADLAGAIWTNRKVLVNRGFDISIFFHLNTSTTPLPVSDGFSFVIQNSGAAPSLSTGGEMGYTGIGNSVAVEFDAFQNIEMNDPDYDHVSIQSGGLSNPNSAVHGSRTLIMDSTLNGLDDGVTQVARIVYNPHAETLNVYINTQLIVSLTGFRTQNHMNLDNGRAYIGVMSTTGDTAYTQGPNVLAGWTASFPQSCEEVFWEKTGTPFTHDGYHGDTFDHKITGTFLQAGDIIREHVDHKWDDMGFTLQDITEIENGANGLWIVESRGGTGLWRGSYVPNAIDGQFDTHAIEPDKASIVTFAQNGGTLGTVIFMQTMTLAKPNPGGGSPIDTGIVVAKHLITYNFVKIDPAFTANYPTCTFNPGILLFHQVVQKQQAVENLYGVWSQAIQPSPLIPCP